jgi:tRNA-2-methylthio-N6-dimethylallyladenosine synthase
MHRGYTKGSYLERIDRLREVCPSIAVTADVIVGFPGEEEEDFRETLDLMEKIRFDDLFSFKYSPRKGTRAAQLECQVQEKTKQDWLSILQKIQRDITLQKNQSLEGRVEEVLVEDRSKQSDRDVTGRTRSNKIVNFPGDMNLVSKLVLVKIMKAYAHSLRGEMTPPLTPVLSPTPAGRQEERGRVRGKVTSARREKEEVSVGDGVDKKR